MTTDAAGAKKFYSALLGWECVDMPMGDAGAYTFLNVRGKEVGALSQMSPDMQKSGMPPLWNSYISVKSADETQKKAEAAGGKTVMPAFDVMDVGRMAMLQDPTGGVFAAWEPKKHHGAALVNEPGALCWNELMTNDPEAAKNFYTPVFGWKTESREMPGMGTYTTVKVGDRPNGGMMKIPAGAPMPPHWGVYFSVKDCDATVKKAQDLGAKVFMPPTDVPGTGRFATLQDPQGAVFSVIKLNQPT
jgi:predicted enzyme related to lactoylglutathione lyase